MPGPSFVVVDPCIRGVGGRYATYARACRAALALHGVQSRCWAHRQVDTALARSLSARPVFTHDCWQTFNGTRGLRFVADPLLAAQDFLRDASFARRTLDDEPVLFATTVDYRQLLAWAWWLRQSNAPARVVLLLRYSYAHHSGKGWVRAAAWVRLALRLLRLAPRGRVRLATDSVRLAAEYRALGAESVSLLPIPHTSVERSHAFVEDGPRRAVMLGDARTEKGFTVLYDAIALLRKYGRVPDVEFVVQANIQSTVYSALADVRDRLRALPGVSLMERALSGEEYEALLASADLVLLPYDGAVYRSRTSGPFAEALAAGIPVVCTADTWMSDQLKTFGAGESFTSGDASSLALAIDRAATRLPQLTAAAVQGRDAWVAFHSPQNFARELLRIATASATP